MSENIEVKGRRVSVSVERKVGDGNYGSTTLRAWAEDDVPDGADHNAVSGLIVELGNAVKAAVYDHMGLEVELDDTGVIREIPAPPTVGTSNAPSGGGMTPEQVAAAMAAPSIRIMNSDKHPNAVIPNDIAALCARNNITGVWANEGKYGIFFKEAVRQGESPVFADDQGRSLILKGNLDA